MKNLILYFHQSKLPALLATLVVFVACTYPSEHLPAVTNDKNEHFIAFFGLGGLWAFHRKNAIPVLLGLVAYGLLIEIWQWILPDWFHRGFDLFDAAADAIGTIVGVLVGVFLKKSFAKYLQV